MTTVPKTNYMLQTIEKIRKENNETLQHCDAKVGKLQQELSDTKQFFQEQVNKIHNDKEKQLQQVYTRWVLAENFNLLYCKVNNTCLVIVLTPFSSPVVTET